MNLIACWFVNCISAHEPNSLVAEVADPRPTSKSTGKKLPRGESKNLTQLYQYNEASIRVYCLKRICFKGYDSEFALIFYRLLFWADNPNPSGLNSFWICPHWGMKNTQPPAFRQLFSFRLQEEVVSVPAYQPTRCIFKLLPIHLVEIIIYHCFQLASDNRFIFCTDQFGYHKVAFFLPRFNGCPFW